jgi:hypothetical protein
MSSHDELDALRADPESSIDLDRRRFPDVQSMYLPRTPRVVGWCVGLRPTRAMPDLCDLQGRSGRFVRTTHGLRSTAGEPSLL